MDSITAPGEMQAWSQERRREGMRIALVPTMGSLHEGHLSLVGRARQEADLVVVSLFVNPTQFGPGEDFEQYPRDPAHDQQLCQAAGVDLLFTPTPDAVYAKDASVAVIERELSVGLCGGSRPGHFDGVVTVVAKLFNMVLPDVAIFGQKDAQQLAIICRMVRDLNFPVQIVAGAIVREVDGLAMSSRNRYLTASHRTQAPALYAALSEVQTVVRQAVLSAGDCQTRITARVARDAPGLVLEYVVICEAGTLQEQPRAEVGSLIAVAGRLGDTRLIDNVIV